VAAANHELGTLAPIPALAAVARERRILFHTDAVQAFGRVPFDVRRAGVDAATLSAHKLGGPKGVGAVFLRRGVDLHPLIAGGHQERERRAGTENLPGIVGCGLACQLAAAELSEAGERLTRLRDRLEAQLLEIPGARRHGEGPRVPGTCNVGFAGAEGHLVLIGLDLEGIAVSTGAACTSGSLAPSPVLLALGLAPGQAREAVRFSLGPENTEEEIDRAARVTASVVARVRAAAEEAA
jgi:cysteine desulfurase